MAEGTSSDTVSNVVHTEEPPSKKCKILSNDKPRLLEDRIGSILSCCICLDLSTLAMFQVEIQRKRKKFRVFFSLSVLMDILCVLLVLIIY
jgi:succinate-acetate transporter protein